jgi:hypothetical protein
MKQLVYIYAGADLNTNGLDYGQKMESLVLIQVPLVTYGKCC